MQEARCTIVPRTSTGAPGRESQDVAGEPKQGNSAS